MKSVIRMFACVALVGCVVKATAEDLAAEQRKGELAAVLQELNAPQQPESYEEHPGWHKSEVREKLKGIVAKYPNTEEAITAELWLATAEVEVGQVSNRAKRVENMLSVASTFTRLIKASPHAWQAKAAHIGKTAALFGAKRWQEFRVESGDVLDSIAEYKGESNAEYLVFLRVQKTNPAEIEPGLRYLLIVAAACEGKTSEAITLAEDLLAKFPEWSATAKLAGTIELLKDGKQAFGCR